MDMQGHGHADGRVGVWTRMRCVWMRMSRKEKEKRKKGLTLLMRMVDVLACGRVACGRVGVWTWMCCVRMRMSRKERKKERKKKLT